MDLEIWGGGGGGGKMMETSPKWPPSTFYVTKTHHHKCYLYFMMPPPPPSLPTPLNVISRWPIVHKFGAQGTEYLATALHPSISFL